MAAILGLGDHVVEDLCTRVEAGVCVPANFNAEGQVVVSGDVAGVEQAMGFARDAGAKRVILLNVSGAFHSPLMEPAAEGLRSHLEGITFHDAAYPVVSNATATAVTDGAIARELLVKQLTSPVRWRSSVETMVSGGVERFFEVGPGKVLCGLIRRNARGVPCTPLGEPADFASLEA
jgi:[acyl-carrier-protein] S-malonyltransferase